MGEGEGWRLKGLCRMVSCIREIGYEECCGVWHAGC